MSSMLSGGAGRAYGFDFENIICPSTTTTTSSRTSHSSSPSSTLSESINSPLAISNRKPRTPRKRPNQSFNEAASLLSIACPKVFSTKNVTNKNHNLSKITTQNGNSFHDPPELLLPFPMTQNSGFHLHRSIMENPNSVFDSKVANFCHSPGEVDFPNRVGVTHSSHGNNLLQKCSVRMRTSGTSWPDTVLDPTHAGASCTGFLGDSNSNSVELLDGFEDDFDTESMLDEEMEHGIDSIMGISHPTSEKHDTNNNYSLNSKTCYGYPMGLGFGGNLEFNFGMGMRNGIRALKNGDGGNWWSFPTVNVVNISPPVAPVTVKKIPVEKKKKRVEELMKRSEPELEHGNSDVRCRLLLKLNYDDILNAWSDKGSPLPEEVSGLESPGGDIHGKLARIDLFSENDGLKEAGVVRYKERKNTRLFSKKIRYQVRKINADRRLRSKGRFVRRPNSPTSEDT
ncbi:protein CHLOROPLAST IMPORT APPARATUS 2 [Helianthus annuus]|uniref:protein CHLOROPLAST IMPORT APPARATUS 2 n=1 Tax=Helianthus annuus TaxID=4232 RepID=UPI000B8F545B|nr:protein CHLOROPLAST IMPORT APPARATUS 2 [Helianthus annuus]